MKHILLYLFFTILFATSYTQISRKTRVWVKDWGQKSMITSDAFWETNETQILQVIGKNEFDSVKKYVNDLNWPKEIRYKTSYVRDTADRKKYYEQLSKLRLYQVAQFKHTFQGKDFGDYSILAIPYDENKTWNTNVKWNTLYILIPTAAIAKGDNIP